MKLKSMMGAGAAVFVAFSAYAGDYPIRPAEMTNVAIRSGFWLSRFETNRLVTVWSDFKKSEEARIPNFALAARRAKGGFRGIPYDDSDVYKIIEGAAYTLATHPDPKLEAYLDDLIAKIAKAQEDDGYLYTARTLGFDYGKKNGETQYGMMGPTRWSNTRASHELYNAGHLYEAAVAYYRVTGKRTLLDVAIRNADLVAKTFGPAPDQLKCVPGHEEIELALVKLFRATGEARYLNLARHFLDQRGTPGSGAKSRGKNHQDHQPVREQREAVGHAVRATYLYCGMTDVAALTGDAGCLKATEAIWENVVSRKLHLNGSIGARRGGESFGADYELPNESAYLETCAGIGNALWNERLFLLHGDAKYVDVMERDIYNGILSGVSLGGDEFFYPNPLASRGGYRRSKWFGTSCCPVNVVRFIPQIAEFAYATRGDALYVNLFVASDATLTLASGPVKLEQRTAYPWEGATRLTVKPARSGVRFALNVRVPGWCVGRPVPSDLYTQIVPGTLADFAVRVNGAPVAFTPVKGYCVLDRAWKAGDVVEVAMNMPVRRIKAHDAVADDRGRLAVERGPIVYCAEGADNGGSVLDKAIPAGATFALSTCNILGNVYPSLVTEAVACRCGLSTSTTEKVPFVLVPYFAWCHRGAGEMQTWFPTEADAAKPGFYTLSDGWLFRLDSEKEPKPVTVPHDWAIERGFLPVKSDPHRGDLPYVGKGFYRRAFDGFTPPIGGRTYLTLDGVQCRSVVKLNGRIVGGRPFGYASETIDVTDFLLPSGNVLEVEAENVKASSRWYPGSGIFREVTVRVCPRDHVKPNTLFFRTLEATEKAARVAVSFETLGGVSNYTFEVKNPRLWSPEHPELYELELFGEKFRYGIRTAAFDPKKGFFLNGVHRQMRGVCQHHDLGSLGAAFDRGAARRQLALLKEMGCDAIRTSHNPPAAALLDLCDEMGVMVMDEAFDMWERQKGDYSNFWQEWHARDLTEFVRRDRSHPCVVMWSVGNEVPEMSEKDPARQIRIGSELVAIVRANDPTRPVTVGSWHSGPMWNGFQKVVDAFGANYLPFKYAEFSRRNPTVGLVGTETCSTVSSRGEYFFPVVASPIAGEGDLRRRRDEGRAKMIRGGQMSGYDLWGPHPNDYPPDIEFEHQERNPQVYGEFVWTGFDYLGEPDPCSGTGGRSSYFGIFDLAGFPKDRYWLYKAHWRPDEPTAHILPHWTWPGREGEVTPVHVYTSGDEAELFVNGKSQGRRKRGSYQYRFVWDKVVYEPGEVKAVTWKNGKSWADDAVQTCGEPVTVRATCKTWGSLDFWQFEALDAKGRVSPIGALRLDFSVTDGALAGVGNGDPTDHEALQGSTIRTFHGLAQAIVRRRSGVEPKLTWKVHACAGNF